MRYANAIVGFLIDAVLRQFSRPWHALVAAALVTAALMLLIIRWTSSPTTIRRARNRLTARVLELLLFRHDAWVSITAGGRILMANLAYLRALLRPFLISAAPGFLVLTQLSCWFAVRPLRVGEAVLIEVKLSDGFPILERRVSLSESPIVRNETEGIRIPRLSEIDWRSARPGVDSIEIHVDDEAAVGKQIVVGEALQKVSQRRSRAGSWQQLLHPVEQPIEGDQSVLQVDVHYPARHFYLGDREVDWLVAFVSLTMIFGLALKRPLGVQL